MSPNCGSLQAQAAFNLIKGLGESELDAAQTRYEELRNLAAHYSDEPELRSLQAQTASI